MKSRGITRKTYREMLPFDVDDFNRINAFYSDLGLQQDNGADLGLIANDEVRRVDDFDLFGNGCKLSDVLIDDLNQHQQAIEEDEEGVEGNQCRKRIPYKNEYMITVLRRVVGVPVGFPPAEGAQPQLQDAAAGAVAQPLAQPQAQAQALEAARAVAAAAAQQRERHEEFTVRLLRRDLDIWGKKDGHIGLDLDNLNRVTGATGNKVKAPTISEARKMKPLKASDEVIRIDDIALNGCKLGDIMCRRGEEVAEALEDGAEGEGNGGCRKVVPWKKTHTLTLRRRTHIGPAPAGDAERAEDEVDAPEGEGEAERPDEGDAAEGDDGADGGIQQPIDVEAADGQEQRAAVVDEAETAPRNRRGVLGLAALEAVKMRAARLLHLNPRAPVGVAPAVAAPAEVRPAAADVVPDDAAPQDGEGADVVAAEPEQQQQQEQHLEHRVEPHQAEARAADIRRAQAALDRLAAEEGDEADAEGGEYCTICMERHPPDDMRRFVGEGGIMCGHHVCKGCAPHMMLENYNAEEGELLPDGRRNGDRKRRGEKKCPCCRAQFHRLEGLDAHGRAIRAALDAPEEDAPPPAAAQQPEEVIAGPLQPAAQVLAGDEDGEDDGEEADWQQLPADVRDYGEALRQAIAEVERQAADAAAALPAGEEGEEGEPGEVVLAAPAAAREDEADDDGDELNFDFGKSYIEPGGAMGLPHPTWLYRPTWSQEVNAGGQGPRHSITWRRAIQLSKHWAPLDKLGHFRNRIFHYCSFPSSKATVIQLTSTFTSIRIPRH